MNEFIAEDYEVLPPGVYQGTFDRIKVSDEPGKFGYYLDWTFNVVTESGTTEVMGRSSLPDRFTRTTKARQWLEGILGRPLAKGESTNTAKLKGTPVVLTLDIVTTEKGDERNRILNVQRAKPQLASEPDKQLPLETGIDPEYAEYLRVREAAKAAVVVDVAQSPAPSMSSAGPADDIAI